MNIFNNLVYNENTFTELFKNIMRFKIFRKEFLGLIDGDVSDENIDFDSFSTQKSTENGRPDLVISTQHSEIFIEIKVWNTPLTDNQPSGYLKELEVIDKSNKILVLLIPKNYKYLDRYHERIWKAKSEIKTQIIFWSEIIDKMDREKIHEENALLSEYRELLREWFEPKQIEINHTFLNIMYSLDTPNSLEKLADLIREIKNELMKSGVEVTSKKTDVMVEYGFYCDHHDSYSLFIGEWFDYWKETGNPLCIAIQTNNKQILNLFSDECTLQGFAKPEDFKDKKDKDTHWLTSKIELSSKGNAVEIIAEKTKNIIDKLRSTDAQDRV
jgi:hypothetical protein